MTPQEQWIANGAMAALDRDDSHPNVGWGLFYVEAVDDAIQRANTTAVIFGGQVGEINRDLILQYVKKLRRI